VERTLDIAEYQLLDKGKRFYRCCFVETFLETLDECVDTAEEDAGSNDENAEQNVSSRCYPERVPVQRRVTV